MEKTKTGSIFTTWNLVTMAMFTSLLCISAYISIPLPNGTHISAINFVVILIVLIFPIKESFFIILAWFLLGTAGIPVFVGGVSGIGYILSPYGGYNISFLVVSVLVPLICSRKYNRLFFSAAAVFTAVTIDLIGTFWIMAVSGTSFKAAFIAGFVPFITLDIVKAVAAAQIVPQLRKLFTALLRGSSRRERFPGNKLTGKA